MPTIYLVRHGRAAAGWDADHDPGLDDEGRAQARDVVETLAPLGPLDLIVSPMARTRETATPLARAWITEPRIEPRLSEIPSPIEDLAARGRWLRDIMTKDWSGLDPVLRRWREDVLTAVTAIAADTVVVTHFIVINVIVGAIIGDDRVVNFRPGYCSVTIVRRDGDRLVLAQRGSEGTTRVL
jgi:broad specificity phosphatase PhoE